MTPDQLAILERIESFDLDGGPAALPFAARLAGEQDWNRGRAERVIREYRRFVFLAVTGAEPVCPSEAVDAAWHLHLTYTRSYWKRFCGEILGQPLHHEPTRGGPAESRKHLTMYAHTLARYREVFGEEPPADIWPPASSRFGDDLVHRSVNTARNWVIPKQPVKRLARAVAAFVAFATLVPGCAGGKWNPFNLVGVEFLWFLTPVMIAAVIAGRVLRSGKRKPDPQPGDDELEFNWEQTAYLAGGYERLTTAAIARLVENGSAVLSDDRKHLERGTRLPDGGLSQVEMAIYNSLPCGNTPTELKSMQAAVESAFGDEARRLEAEGFVLSTPRQASLGYASVIPLLLVMVFFAIPRLFMGIANDRPVVFLVITIVVGGIICGIAALAGSYRLSRRGDAVLARLKSEHVELKSGKGGSNFDPALAVALFGTMALAGTSLAYMQTWYPRITTDSSGGGCGTSSGGTGGGGDGGGGGGCGGCGGGD